MTAAPEPGEHGGDAHLHGFDVELSASLNPVAPDPVPLFRRHLDAVHRYPNADRAAAALAEVVGVERERVLLTNGGAEAIALVAANVGAGWIVEPEFSLYRRHLTVDPAAGRWLSDPNNPTGRLAAPAESAAVRDEAFYPLATGSWTRGDAGTIVVGSLTKVFACPGVRIGYVIAPDDRLIADLAAAQPRWALSGLAGAAVPDLLASADLPRWRREIGELRDELSAVLVGRGWRPDPATANYLWLPDASGLRDAMAAGGVLVRSGVSFGYPAAVRIAVPRVELFERVVAAIPHRQADGGPVGG